MIKRLKLGNSSGDTIVEVLIVLAVLSLAFTISYATASQALTKTRNAEEHSEALGLLNSQVELVRKAVYEEPPVTLPPTEPFCMIIASPPYKKITLPANIDDLESYPIECQKNDFYRLSIVYSVVSNNGVSSPSYNLRVRWDGPGGLGRQQEQITYRVRPL